MISKPNEPAMIHFIDGKTIKFTSVRSAYDEHLRMAFVWASYAGGKETISIPLSSIKFIAQ